MANKQAGLAAALAVLVIVFGLIIIVGVILLMMWFQPDIEHSPAQIETTSEFHSNRAIPVPELTFPEHINHPLTGVHT
jgi:hypothetical protein